MPLFAAENFEHNKDLVVQFAAIAEDLGCTSGRLAIDWLLAQSDDSVPIPGTKRRTNLSENVVAVDVVLSTDLAPQVADLMSAVAGDRYG
ncbi:MAG: aryl-alcohol dehydrogenase-like predicted oxidoreductase [Actinomycetes bacterium]|jgi:aryl-alcohol dehydrogenase-like predicted oxidoreductase